MNGMKFLLVIMLACCAATASAQSLTLSLDDTVYELGDIMQITIANPSDQDVEFLATPPYCVYNVDHVDCTSVPESTTFAAGSVWNVDYNTDDGVLSAGAALVLLTWLEDGTTHHLTEVFSLTTSVPDTPTAWGALKGHYR